ASGAYNCLAGASTETIAKNNGTRTCMKKLQRLLTQYITAESARCCTSSAREDRPRAGNDPVPAATMRKRRWRLFGRAARLRVRLRPYGGTILPAHRDCNPCPRTGVGLCAAGGAAVLQRHRSPHDPVAGLRPFRAAGGGWRAGHVPGPGAGPSAALLVEPGRSRAAAA